MFQRKYKMIGWLVVVGAVIVGAFKSEMVKEWIAKTGIKL
jgi:hypothetical protein